MHNLLKSRHLSRSIPAREISAEADISTDTQLNAKQAQLTTGAHIGTDITQATKARLGVSASTTPEQADLLIYDTNQQAQVKFQAQQFQFGLPTQQDAKLQTYGLMHSETLKVNDQAEVNTAQVHDCLAVGQVSQESLVNEQAKQNKARFAVDTTATRPEAISIRYHDGTRISHLLTSYGDKVGLQKSTPETAIHLGGETWVDGPFKSRYQVNEATFTNFAIDQNRLSIGEAAAPMVLKAYANSEWMGDFKICTLQDQTGESHTPFCDKGRSAHYR